MLSFALEFKSEQELEQAIEALRKQHNITGEMHARPLDDGRWRLIVHSEKTLRDTTLVKIKGERVDLSD